LVAYRPLIYVVTIQAFNVATLLPSRKRVSYFSSQISDV